eukprot:CAMPEP_0118693648 /NCGR_PEP_ID=MMETSP0800-20121206/12034_1 /TAXON_ID=210618 ORGANISM="Striatella unipunctata, Strain CCMP2910" /NCGR_SAMPLE_ID=MMETSP0800 /ASSEMBLY_ACC=CAM_ASM_000638 /LENGTH=333 /DNA_ID=CAMNT_0006591925 /DNA_START=96 /DNA_END=1097 /DNA_ORIENTATION=-
MNGTGWPPLVKLALEITHSANYEFKDLPKERRDKLMEEIALLTEDIQAGVLLGKRVLGHPNELATGTTFAIKAPASMLLVPAFLAKWGKMRFIHVVRDGRDVALSTNQSPVNKFYNTSYVDGEKRFHQYPNNNVKAMHLWNDWNAQLYEWEKRHSDGKTFDYLVIRTEDLVRDKTRLQTLLRLADFVGANLTDAALCCLGSRRQKDYGKSEHIYTSQEQVPKKKKQKVYERYGKWQAVLAQDPELFEDLHRDGERALEMFGYEPKVRFMDGTYNQTKYICEKRFCMVEYPPIRVVQRPRKGITARHIDPELLRQTRNNPNIVAVHKMAEPNPH